MRNELICMKWILLPLDKKIQHTLNYIQIEKEIALKLSLFHYVNSLQLRYKFPTFIFFCFLVHLFFIKVFFSLKKFSMCACSGRQICIIVLPNSNFILLNAHCKKKIQFRILFRININ